MTMLTYDLLSSGGALQDVRAREGNPWTRMLFSRVIEAHVAKNLRFPDPLRNRALRQGGPTCLLGPRIGSQQARVAHRRQIDDRRLVVHHVRLAFSSSESPHASLTDARSLLTLSFSPVGQTLVSTLSCPRESTQTRSSLRSSSGTRKCLNFPTSPRHSRSARKS